MAGGTQRQRGKPVLAWATHRCASRVRRCPQRTLPRFWQSVTDAHKALGEGWVRDAERYQLDRTLIRMALQAEHALGLRGSLTKRYDALSHILDEQLGLQPSHETRMMYRQLLGQN